MDLTRLAPLNVAQMSPKVPFPFLGLLNLHLLSSEETNAGRCSPSGAPVFPSLVSVRQQPVTLTVKTGLIFSSLSRSSPKYFLFASVPTFVFLKEEESWTERRSERKRLTNREEDLRSTAGKERQRSSAARRSWRKALGHVVCHVLHTQIQFTSIATLYFSSFMLCITGFTLRDYTLRRYRACARV